MKQSNSRASTPTGLFRIPQTLQTPKTPQNPRTTRSVGSTSVTGAERTPIRLASTTPTPMSRAPLDTVESTAMVSSALATQGTPSQGVIQLCCQGKSNQVNLIPEITGASIANILSRQHAHF